MNNWVQMFTGLLLYAYVGTHQVRRMVFGNYQMVLSAFKASQITRRPKNYLVHFSSPFANY